MVDTIRCQSDLDLTEAFYEKLLLGAISKKLDHKQIAAHEPAKDNQDFNFPLPHRSTTLLNGKEPQWSDDEVPEASLSRGNTLHTNRSSTQEAEEPRLRAAQRSSTISSHGSHWYQKKHAT